MKALPATKTTKEIKSRLEYLRGELNAERISYSELHELQCLGEQGHIPESDVQLREAAGLPEFPEGQEILAMHKHTPEAPPHWNNSEAAAWSQGYESGKEAFTDTAERTIRIAESALTWDELPMLVRQKLNYIIKINTSDRAALAKATGKS